MSAIIKLEFTSGERFDVAGTPGEKSVVRERGLLRIADKYKTVHIVSEELATAEEMEYAV